MCWVATSALAGASFGNTGNWFFLDPDGTVAEVSLPTGVNGVNAKPSFATFNSDAKSRLYTVGGFTDNLVFTENFNLMRQGIVPPPNPIVNAAGSGNNVGLQASGTGITGTCIGYIRWWDNNNQRRSPLSGPSPTLTLTNQGLAWSNLPTNPRDPSVTHIELWRAMDGNSPRLAVRRDLGTTAVTENIATGSLGQAETEDFSRFPRCRYNVMWHDRQVMAGDDRHPDRLYFSVLTEPEQYAQFYIRTRKGEPIVGLISMRDQLIVLCPTSSYVVEGYTEDDIKMDILEPEIGGISHHGIVQVHGWAIVPTHLGIYLCTGTAFHFISKEFQHTWVSEYQENQDAYEASWAVNDVETGVYKLYVGTHSLTSGQTYWTLDYSDLVAEVGGSFAQPALSLDVRARVDESAAILKVPGGRRGALFTGSQDGFIREENIQSADDDGLDFTVIIETSHYYPEGAGGGEGEGVSYTEAWAHAVSEQDPYTINSYGGGDYANQYLVASATESVDAGEELLVADTLAPKTYHVWFPDHDGRGITRKYTWTSPDEIEWNGDGVAWKTGSDDRRVVVEAVGT